MSTAKWTDIVSKYIYDKESTINNKFAQKYPDFLIPYNKLCLDEGCIKKTLSNELVISLDNVAEKEYPRNIPKTMDFMHCVRIRNNTSNSKSYNLILSECRFRYKNVNNIEKKDLQGKINGSRTLLASESSNILNVYIFIFSDKLINQAVHYLFRLNPKFSWLAVTASEYNQIFV